MLEFVLQHNNNYQMKEKKVIKKIRLEMEIDTAKFAAEYGMEDLSADDLEGRAVSDIFMLLEGFAAENTWLKIK